MSQKVVLVRFFTAEGELDRTIEAPLGARLLDVAQEAGQPLEGTCEGQMACSTCHVLLSVEGDEPPPPREEEEDLLDFAYGATAQSRLACQIVLAAGMQRVDVTMPGGSVDMTA